MHNFLIIIKIVSCYIKNNLKYSVLQINVNISKIIANSINTRTVNDKRLKNTKAFIHLHGKYNYIRNERLMLTKPQSSFWPFTLPIKSVRTSVYVPLSSSGSCAVFFWFATPILNPVTQTLWSKHWKLKQKTQETTKQTICSLFWYEHVTNNDTEACDWTGWTEVSILSVILTDSTCMFWKGGVGVFWMTHNSILHEVHTCPTIRGNTDSISLKVTVHSKMKI